MDEFRHFFERATGVHPYSFQETVAARGLPDLLEVPTGAGKSAAVVLGWLWRRIGISDPAVRSATPRRLVVALPMRTLVDQFAADTALWLERLGFSDRVALHVVMGGSFGTQQAWRLDMHREAIVIGTTDTIVSKALCRGYGTSRAGYPIDFALVGNGTHIVLDELQLAPQTCVTVRQVKAFQRSFGTAEPSGLTCMSATVPRPLLDTVDNPWPGESAEVVGLSERDDDGELGRRLRAVRRVEQLLVSVGDYPQLARAVLARHVAGTRTLVIMNTVDAAVAVASRLERLGSGEPVVLLHSRFRPVERQAAVKLAVGGIDPSGPGVIVVATQVVEAGVDITSETLVTEAAPWSSVIQRLGRCNRYAESGSASVLWCEPRRPLPYEQADVDATAGALRSLEGRSVAIRDLLAMPVAQTLSEPHVLRRKDFIDLFDTTPDLSGNDIDVGMYLRDAEDLDAAAAWVALDIDATGPSSRELPARDALCPVPLGAVRDLAKGRTLWRYDAEQDVWFRHRVTSPRVRPGEVLLVSAAEGGYDVRLGLAPSSRLPVPIIGAESVERTLETAGLQTEDPLAEAGALAQLRWQPLDDHLAETSSQAHALVASLSPVLPAGAESAVVEAARLHDIGKAFEPWQRALLAVGSTTERPEPGRVFAKSPGIGRLIVDGHVGFRHELLGALILRSDRSLSRAPVDLFPLVRYLVAAHHGRVRVQARDTLERSHDASAAAGGTRLLGLDDGATVQVGAYLGRPAGPLVVDLAEFQLGGAESWTRESLSLLDRYGPFVLAYLETLVRVADWRASAAAPLPEAAER